MLGFGLAQGNPCAFNAAGGTSARFGGGVNPAMETFLSRSLRIADRFGTKINAYEVLNEMNRLPVDCDKKENGATIDGKPYLVAIDPLVVGRMTTKFYRFCQGISLPNGELAHCPEAKILLGACTPRAARTTARTTPPSRTRATWS